MAWNFVLLTKVRKALSDFGQNKKLILHYYLTANFDVHYIKGKKSLLAYKGDSGGDF